MVLPVPVGAFRMIWRYCIVFESAGIDFGSVFYPLSASSDTMSSSRVNWVMYLNLVRSSPLSNSSVCMSSNVDVPTISRMEASS